MIDYVVQLATPVVAAIGSIAVAIMTHRRAKKAHKDTITVDHTRLIQEGYQDILDQLRAELDRRKASEERLRTRLESLEKEIEHEIGVRKELQRTVQELLEELSGLREDYTNGD